MQPPVGGWPGGRRLRPSAATTLGCLRGSTHVARGESLARQAPWAPRGRILAPQQGLSTSKVGQIQQSILELAPKSPNLLQGCGPQGLFGMGTGMGTGTGTGTVVGAWRGNQERAEMAP